MQNLSKPELISVLDFIFDTQRIKDSAALYESLKRLAYDTLRCEELVIGTCSDSALSGKCHLQPPEDPALVSEERDGGKGDAERKLSCRSSCTGSPSASDAGGAPPSDITETDDGIMVCNYSTKSPALCAAFVRKDQPLSEDQQLLDGLTPYLSAAIGRLSANAVVAKAQGKQSEPIVLTTREKEILQWVAVGKSCGETGSILGVTERTVKFHLQNVYRKLAVVNRAQAVTVAHQHALL